MNPIPLVIAGPNGSGKTTITTRLRLDRWSEGVEYLKPDDIARGPGSTRGVRIAARLADFMPRTGPPVPEP